MIPISFVAAARRSSRSAQYAPHGVRAEQNNTDRRQRERES